MGISSWFKGLKGRLLLSAFVPVVAFIALTVLSLHVNSKLGEKLETAYEDYIPSYKTLDNVLVYRASTGYFMWAALGSGPTPEVRKDYIKKTRKAFDSMKKFRDQYESRTDFTEQEKKNYAAALGHKKDVEQVVENVIALIEKGTPESEAEARGILSGKWIELATELREGVEANIKIHDVESAEEFKAQAELRAWSRNLMILVGLFSVVGLLAALMWVAYRISSQVGQLASKLDGSSHEVSAAITQLSQAGDTLSHATTEAAASLEETVASLEEMSSMVQMNSDNAKQAATLSQASRESAESGEKQIHNLVESMHDISASSKKIEEIISVIDDIAFQTNLLALNAAVEAARAGEQGKGFAVVAEAVRTLAQRSAAAAKDINGLIKDSVEKIERGTDIADQSGSILSNIVTSVKKVSDLNNEIAAASSEQTTGIQQISKAMNQLDQGVQANAASTEEIASTAQEISHQSVQMKSFVADLNMVVQGGAKTVGFVAEKDPVVATYSSAKTSKPVSTKGKVLNFTKAKPAPKAEVKKSPIAARKAAGSDIIPFDEDDVSDSRAKIGNTDGF
jgi:Methyl-accepting chemotaxis protein